MFVAGGGTQEAVVENGKVTANVRRVYVEGGFTEGGDVSPFLHGSGLCLQTPHNIKTLTATQRQAEAFSLTAHRTEE